MRSFQKLYLPCTFYCFYYNKRSSDQALIQKLLSLYESPGHLIGHLGTVKHNLRQADMTLYSIQGKKTERKKKKVHEMR